MLIVLEAGVLEGLLEVLLINGWMALRVATLKLKKEKNWWCFGVEFSYLTLLRKNSPSRYLLVIKHFLFSSGKKWHREVHTNGFLKCVKSLSSGNFLLSSIISMLLDFILLSWKTEILLTFRVNRIFSKILLHFIFIQLSTYIALLKIFGFSESFTLQEKSWFTYL